jgi:ankyrin repeat protein
VTSDVRLHRASENGDAELALKLLSEGVDANTVDSNERTPLHWAVAQGKARVVEILLDHGARTDAREGLLSQTPLHLAWGQPNKIIATILIARGSNVNAKDAHGSTPLHGAMLPTAEVLIANGADVRSINADGETPLHSIAFSGYAEVIELLIHKGADVNARNNKGETPLHSVAQAVQEILPKIDPISAASRLIKAGTDINAKDVDGDTPLHKAVEMSNLRVATVLIASHCDVNAKNKLGSTPLYYATSRPTPRQDIIQLIERHGGKNEGSPPPRKLSVPPDHVK